MKFYEAFVNNYFLQLQEEAFGQEKPNKQINKAQILRQGVFLSQRRGANCRLQSFNRVW